MRYRFKYAVERLKLQCNCEFQYGHELDGCTDMSVPLDVKVRCNHSVCRDT